ncbi:sorting nexin-14 isoform X1 [Dendroctonus ponderosae]|uniref:sorting nexin-14 isoform X1 n=1 Tax=Dendroctonus ponderosae TaxID=77166 RepID=UPI002035CFA6|nr:sorting nexin-14 isoform X1 [Dendroctonus ponderosae]KAH1008819.1 hypothetical protein HUJ05_009339 [Dendroctonus ponderosae]
MGMILANIAHICTLIYTDNYVRVSSIAVILFCGLLCFFSSFSGVLVFSCYIFGYLASLLLIKYQYYAISCLKKFLERYTHSPTIKLSKLKASCSVCDNLTCRRHYIAHSATPWKDIKISLELNNAIEHFFNKILTNFILVWYNQFTDSGEFVNELRYCFKYASATLINRFFRIDHIEIITNKLVPQVIKHIDDYLYMHQIGKLKNVKFHDVIVEYLGTNLHPATTNRKNELLYLQHLSNELIRYLLPHNYVNCKNYSVLLRELLSGWVLLPLMDVIADPNIINSLVILTVNYKPSRTPRPQDLSPEVEFLCTLVEVDSSKRSPFATSLNQIKNSTDLLYAFMQFLKKQEQVHLLQFCLDVDDFNAKLLTPDLTKKQLEELHVQALNLHKEYFQEDSFNFIGCSSGICAQFSALIDDIYRVAKLRTSKPLYQAYDFAFNQLEGLWLPQFFHSNEFYKCICGSKATSSFNKAAIKSKRFCEQSSYGTVSKFSSSIGKIKGVLKTATPVEGCVQHLKTDFTENDLLPANLTRDLSNWKVTISSYKVIPDTKIIYFCLNISYVDNSGLQSISNNWLVWRKDQDFFTLKSKLVEFHGESEICDSPLPSRKAGALVEPRIAKYESFLIKLLQKPSLRGSDLLHTFLTRQDDFTLVISTMAPNSQDMGNIYQSVAYKLRKEKGQYLDTFINTFVSSVTKPKQEKVDIAEEGVELDASIDEHSGQTHARTFNNDVFKNNFAIPCNLNPGISASNFNPALFSESLFYLFRQVFKINNVVLRIYVAICSVMQKLVDLFAKLVIETKIKTMLTQHNLAHLIRLLEDAIFAHRSHHTADEYDARKDKAFRNIEFCPNYLDRCLGGHMNEGLRTLLDVLQNPHYNKQLCYNLFDVLLIEMFPELNEAK